MEYLLSLQIHMWPAFLATGIKFILSKIPLPISCSCLQHEKTLSSSIQFSALSLTSGYSALIRRSLLQAGTKRRRIHPFDLFIGHSLSTSTFRKNTSGSHKMVSSAYLAFTILVSVAAGLVLAAESYSTGFGFKAAEQGSTPQTIEEGSIPQAPGSVYIVHMEKNDDDSNASEKSHLETLSSVFDGSHEKAKEAILYNYTNSMNGFSAKLTPAQVSELSKKPGVLAVNPQGVSHLHGKPNTHVGAAKAGLSRKGGV